MPEIIPLHPSAPWVELRSTPEDWDAADPALLRTMLGQTHIIRAFEEAALELGAAGLIHGPVHSSIGQEGGAVGSAAALRGTDAVNGTHRGHHQFLAKVIGYVAPGGLDLAELITPRIEEALTRTLAEIVGLEQGFGHGRGGSMHLQWHEAGALGTNAIVGGGVPLAAGNAFAQKHAHTDDVTVTYFGDGAANIGSVLESLNLTAAWKLPLCFFVENNLYAVSTHVEEVTGDPRLSGRGPGFGVASWRVDGMDPLAVYLATGQAVAHMRAGSGPTLVEAEVYRYFHQNGPFPGSAFGYRAKDEESGWRDRDPLGRLEREMAERGLLDGEVIASVRAQAVDAMARIVAGMVEADPDGRDGARRVIPSLWPKPEFVDVGVRGDMSELAGSRYLDPQEIDGETRAVKLVEAAASVMLHRMDVDERVVIMGEDVHHLKGGTNGATKGIAEAHPDRLLGTPISENAFAGLAGGMALDGRFRPIVEFMYSDFMWVAADQVFNQIAKARHMFGGESAVPLVLRSKVAVGAGYGSQHSMDPAGVYATSPGWRIVAPSTPFDYVGLMNTAIALDDPVLVLEHVDLYQSTGEIPAEDLDYRIPVGKAAVRREGSDVTILTYLSMVGESLAAVEETGVDAEVIDLRWLDRASLDWETVGESIRKTNKVLIVEQGAIGTSYGGWLSDELQRRFFDWLDAPIQRVTGTEASPSICKVLERAAIAKAPEVADGIRRTMREVGR